MYIVGISSQRFIELAKLVFIDVDDPHEQSGDYPLISTSAEA